MTLSSRPEVQQADHFGVAAHGDVLDGLWKEATGILQKQYEKGSNGYVKSKYVTLTIEEENIQSARAWFSYIEADHLNRFKVMGTGARGLNEKQWQELLSGLLHLEGGSFAFEWDWLLATGQSVKDFIAPYSIQFGDSWLKTAQINMWREGQTGIWTLGMTDDGAKHLYSFDFDK